MQCQIALLGRAVNRQMRAVLQQWREERQALDVVPMEMAQQDRRSERTVCGELLAEVAEPRSEVEQHRIDPVDIERHT